MALKRSRLLSARVNRSGPTLGEALLQVFLKTLIGIALTAKLLWDWYISHHL